MLFREQAGFLFPYTVYAEPPYNPGYYENYGERVVENMNSFENDYYYEETFINT